MTDHKVFIDSNILLYLLDNDDAKKEKASSLLNPEFYISTQVVTENVNVCLKKYGLNKSRAFAHGNFLLSRFKLIIIDARVVSASFDICSKYSLSFWDSLIISSALSAGCSILYSEDMQDGLVIEEKVKIVNPFKIH